MPCCKVTCNKIRLYLCNFLTGIIESMWGVGAIIGFQISAFIVGIWVDFYRVDTETIDLTPRDPRYVGAWWLGTLIASSLFVLFSIPFWGFPKNLVRNDCPEHNGNISKDNEKTEIIRKNKHKSSLKGKIRLNHYFG